MSLASEGARDAATAACLELRIQHQIGQTASAKIYDVDVEDGLDMEETEEPLDEDVLPRLKEAKAFMTTSEAFQRFREDLQLFVFPSVSQYIRTIISNA